MRFLALGVLALSAVFIMQDATAQQRIPRSHAIYIGAVEFMENITWRNVARLHQAYAR